MLFRSTDFETTPWKVGMQWAVKLDKEDFVGKAALLRHQKREDRELLVPWTMPAGSDRVTGAKRWPPMWLHSQMRVRSGVSCSSRPARSWRVPEIVIDVIRSVVVMLMLLTGMAYMTLFERRVISRMQVRLGPNRTGPSVGRR